MSDETPAVNPDAPVVVDPDAPVVVNPDDADVADPDAARQDSLNDARIGELPDVDKDPSTTQPADDELDAEADTQDPDPESWEGITQGTPETNAEETTE